jgi:hypothetical protein
MRNLGKIRLAVKNDKYQIQFKYATPQKIDFFALTLLEIIKRQKQFSGKTLAEILLMLEIPEDLHNIFEERLHELINNSPAMILYNDYGNSIILDCEVSDFALTLLGEETYLSKEIIEESKNFAQEYIYEHENNVLSEVRTANIQPEKEAIMLDTRNGIGNDELIKIFTSIITKQKNKYIPTANSKTQIFDMCITPTNTVLLRDNIEVNFDGDNVIFDHKNRDILNAFLNIPETEKKAIRTKMFCYLNVPHNLPNLEKLNIATKRSQPIAMKVIFGNENELQTVFGNNIVAKTETTQVFDVSGLKNCVFAGFTTDNKTLIYRYTEVEDSGFTIPLEETDYSQESYLKIFSEIWEQCADSLTDNGVIQFILQISLNDKYREVIKKIAEANGNSNEVVNTLLSINETATIEALGLAKLYNELLENGKLNTVSHKCNLFATYSDYSKQLETLKKSGFEDYYSYAIPKDWNGFMKEVSVLKALFEKLKDRFTDAYKKQATDFFTKVEEDFYNLAPIDEAEGSALLKTDNWQKDVNVALNSKDPNFQAIAAVIRGKFTEKFREIEKSKDTTASDSRKGKELIAFVLDGKQVNEAYKHWKNLCILVHPETSAEQQLTKAPDGTKKQALQTALDFYKKQLKEKKK